MGTSGALDDKEGAGVRIAELNDAVAVLRSPEILIDLESNLAALLDDPAVRMRLWKREVRSVERVNGAAAPSAINRLRIQPAEGASWLAATLLGSPENIPTKQRVARLAKSQRVEEVIAATLVSREHLLLGRYKRDKASVREVARFVFRFGDGVSRKSSPELLLFPE